MHFNVSVFSCFLRSWHDVLFSKTFEPRFDLSDFFIQQVWQWSGTGSAGETEPNFRKKKKRKKGGIQLLFHAEPGRFA